MATIRLPALDPGSPAQASLPTEPFPPQGRSPINLLDCASRRFAGLSTVPAWHPNRSPSAKTARCSAALLGPITPASRFAHQSNLHEEDRTRNRVALEKTGSSGASSRLAPTRTRKLSPLPAGGDRNLGTYRPREARTASRRPSGLRKTTITLNSLAHRTTWLRSALRRAS